MSFAQALPGGGAWAPGPAASGDRATLAGVIDVPSNGATLTAPGKVTVSGWFVDQTAQGWAGADDVEIFLGTMDGGGKPLAHAQVALSRPDVASALKNGFWAPSGFSASASSALLANGANALSVYVHTPGRGWWLRQVSVTLRPAPPPARGAPAPQQPAVPAPSPFGNDLSYPQCPTGAEPPAPAFAIVGVTGGKPFFANPCLPREYAWALSATSANQPHVGFYLNTADPGPGVSPHWPAAGTSAPRVCDGSWSADCAYDYGWAAAQDAFNRGIGVVGAAAATQVPWWIDVEAANTWSSDPSVNAATLQGAVDFLHSVNVGSLGIYSTSTDWDALLAIPPGSGPFAGLPNWRPGPGGPQDAPGWCSRTVTGGRVKFVQFPGNGFDTDLACY